MLSPTEISPHKKEHVMKSSNKIQESKVQGKDSKAAKKESEVNSKIDKSDKFQDKNKNSKKSK